MTKAKNSTKETVRVGMTPRMLAVLREVAKFIAREKRSPTLAELADVLLCSDMTIYYTVRLLRQAGFIVPAPKNARYSIWLTEEAEKFLSDEIIEDYYGIVGKIKPWKYRKAKGE